MIDKQTQVTFKHTHPYTHTHTNTHTHTHINMQHNPTVYECFMTEFKVSLGVGLFKKMFLSSSLE